MTRYLTPRQRLRSSLCAAGMIGSAAFGWMVIWETRAHPHEAPTGWSYPWACCSGVDCRQMPIKAVSERTDGYHTPSGEVLPYSDKRVRPSPDGEWHWCTVAGKDDGKTICLFVPDRGF